LTPISLINKVIFLGTPDFAVPTLLKLSETKYKPVLVITQPDKPQGRKLRLTPSPVKKAARSLGIEVLEPENIKKDEVFELLRTIDPDVIITAAYGGFLNRRILNLPTCGCLNLHPSLLPLYRGATPINHALFNGDEKTGVTIAGMVLKMDSGPVYKQQVVPVSTDDNYSILSPKLARLGAEMVIEVLTLLENDNIEAIPQKEEDATYCYKLKKEDLFLNWAEPAQKIHNRVRGLADNPGAVSFFRGNKIKILETKLLEERADLPPGTVSELKKNEGIVINCWDDKILLTKVQPAGKRVMTAFEYSIGARIEKEENFISGDSNRP